MQIEEHNNFIKLFDLYGNLLSKKQFEVMDKHLNFDLGESELAELLGESRQSVHDAVTKAKKQLLEFEEKCKFAKTLSNLKENLLEVKTLINENNKASKMLDDIIKEI